MYKIEDLDGIFKIYKLIDPNNKFEEVTYLVNVEKEDIPSYLVGFLLSELYYPSYSNERISSNDMKNLVMYLYTLYI